MTEPETYEQLLGLGWRWARIGNETPHLVPPRGDAALCMRPVERTRRVLIQGGIASIGCRKCMQRAGVEARNPRSAEPLELGLRAEGYPGE